MTEQQLREEMVQIGASLFSRGYATGSAGNLSLLLPDGNLLATPTGRYNAFLLANHGPVVTGSSLREATNNTEELEETARLIFTLGNREIRYLTADEVKELR